MTPGVRCVRIRENARIGVGTVITETEMLPFLVDPGSENALKLKQLVTANTPLYRLPAQGQSTPKSKVLLSDAARDAKIVKKAEKKKELAAQRAEAAKARDDAAKARDRTFHCKACDRPFLTERHGMAHQASCGGKRVVAKASLRQGCTGSSRIDWAAWCGPGFWSYMCSILSTHNRVPEHCQHVCTLWASSSADKCFAARLCSQQWPWPNNPI